MVTTWKSLNRLSPRPPPRQHPQPKRRRPKPLRSRAWSVVLSPTDTTSTRLRAKVAKRSFVEMRWKIRWDSKSSTIKFIPSSSNRRRWNADAMSRVTSLWNRVVVVRRVGWANVSVPEWNGIDCWRYRSTTEHLISIDSRFCDVLGGTEIGETAKDRRESIVGIAEESGAIDEADGHSPHFTGRRTGKRHSSERRTKTIRSSLSFQTSIPKDQTLLLPKDVAKVLPSSSATEPELLSSEDFQRVATVQLSYEQRIEQGQWISITKIHLLFLH